MKDFKNLYEVEDYLNSLSEEQLDVFIENLREAPKNSALEKVRQFISYNWEYSTTKRLLSNFSSGLDDFVYFVDTDVGWKNVVILCLGLFSIVWIGYSIHRGSDAFVYKEFYEWAERQNKPTIIDFCVTSDFGDKSCVVKIRLNERESDSDIIYESDLNNEK